MALILEEFLPYRFNRLAETLSKNASRAYRAEYGLTRPEWRAFALLGQKGTMTATEISYLSAMHKTKVSRAIFALEQRHWIAREVDAEDRRLERISLTREGRTAYRRLVPMMLEVEERVLSCLGEKNSAALQQGLKALEALFQEPKTAIHPKKQP